MCRLIMAMINAWADGTKPWSFPEVEDAVREVASLRMQLLPYIYSTFAQYYFEGVPPFRAMNLVAPYSDSSAQASGKGIPADSKLSMNTNLDFNDLFMMGDNLLVAPLFAGEKSRKVYLPSGKWYDFYTGAFVGENEVIEVSPGIEKIPLFVKNGGIIPMVPFHLHAPTMDEKLPLEIRCFGNTEGSFKLYDDDGETFDYLQGEYSFTMLKLTRDASGKLRGSVQYPEQGKPFGYSITPVWKFMTTE